MSLLGRILPIAVGVAVVAAIGAYVVYGQQQETKQRRARANQDQPAPQTRRVVTALALEPVA